MTDSNNTAEIGVGDVVLIVADFSGRYTHLVGMQTEIIEMPTIQATTPPTSMPTYTGRMPDGKLYAFARGEIRKIEPPRDDLQVVQWSACPWQPQQVRA